MSTEHTARCNRVDARRKEASELIASVVFGALPAIDVATELKKRGARLTAMVASVGFSAGGAAAKATQEIVDLLARDKV